MNLACMQNYISLIRLEFNSKDCEYYTELDAVKLIGIKPKSKLLLVLSHEGTIG